MPHRDDFEDFDKSNEGLVSQIGVKSVEDEDIDVSLKLAHVDMYERLLREVGSVLFGYVATSYPFLYDQSITLC